MDIGLIVTISKTLPRAVVFTTRTARLPYLRTELPILKQATTAVTANRSDYAIPLKLAECVVTQFDHQVFLLLGNLIHVVERLDTYYSLLPAFAFFAPFAVPPTLPTFGFATVICGSRR